jgi:very-short-patch-repair endonuclease
MPFSHNDPVLRPYRRDLRKRGTPAEASLWSRLKNRQVGGLLFRRQFSIDNYILDFYCPEYKIAVELDGEQHNTKVDADVQRDKSLLDHYGIYTIRYENRHVFERPQQILDEILEVAGKRGYTP